MKCKIILPALLFCLSPVITLSAAPLFPAKLSCEYQQNPLGIDTRIPRFSWTFSSTDKNQVQQGYELIVSNQLKEVQQYKGSEWNTGNINSSESIQVEYKGNPLRSFTRYYWRVKVYNQLGESAGWSAIHWFETAMLDNTDWTAQWIWDGNKAAAREEDQYKSDPMPLFRKAFKLSKKVAAARLYISGVGYYEAFLNGKKISDHVLDPGWTAYGKQVLYVTHDITSLLKKGDNIAGIMLGSGWWNPLPFKLFGRWQLKDYQQTGRPCVKAEMHIRYTDGSVEKILTSQEWLTAPGPVVRNNVYLGEHYDARQEQTNWLTKTSISPDTWKNALIAGGPAGELTAQTLPPIRVTRIVQPVSITETGKDTFIVNMGQNFAGVARLKVKGSAGTTVRLRLGEGVFSNGSINLMTTATTQIKKGGIKAGPGAPETAWQEDSYTLKGSGLEIWAPRFTFHGFQYVEITGWPGKPTLQDIEGLRMNTDLSANGDFSCSNEMFNQLHQAVQWTFLSNIFSVQSDCPGREKMGYGADMVVSANAFFYNYQMGNFYGKAVRDFANDQRPQGGMTEIAPSTGINEMGYGDSTGSLGWQLAFPYLQKQLYEFYGDKRVIENQYAAFQRQIAFLQSKADRNLFYWDIGDHAALDPKAESFSASAFYYQHIKLAAEFATILDKKEDAARYGKLAIDIKRSITRHFWVPGTGRFDNGTQSAQLFALWHDLTPEKEKSLEWLQQEIERHKVHLSTGIFGTQMLFDVLRNAGRNELAYSIADKRDYPGWGYMLANGATTLWESWAFPETGPSRNHPMFGSVDEWFYRSLLGINAAAPGFKKIIIQPQPAGDLKWAKGTYQSIHGNIGSSWKKENNQFYLQVNIPANTSAEVWIPAVNGAAVTESGKVVLVKKYEAGYAVIETGSGEYNYAVK